MNKNILSILALIQVIGCTATSSLDKKNKDSATRSAKDIIIGTWHSVRELKDGITEEVNFENFADGTYRSQRKYIDRNGLSAERIQVGQWGVSGDILFTIARGWVEGCSIVTADTNDPDTYNAFEILTLSDKKIIYQHVRETTERSLFKMDENADLETDAFADCGYISARSKNRSPV